MNDNAFEAAVSVDNSASGVAALEGAGVGGGDNEATIGTTGPDSVNRVTFETTTRVNVDNNNNLNITNINDQNASSGDATVDHNTTGGSATTGDASNTNTTTIRFDVTN
jgi:hypothetical protein